MNYRTTYNLIQWIAMMIGFLAGYVLALIMTKTNPESDHQAVIIPFFVIFICLVAITWKSIKPFESLLRKEDEQNERNH